ncbi:hypothetical protein A9F13_14g00704 [Clavispora lusitaniae]|uniref:Uncharacterized protein n=1 Tax=Clavispora lusitaniae TaxID=36911 RepID=A0AA91PX60_CLALS|nr:hypothetical protein A9F13_14g00704 [Clavispora lusitaniae]
MQDPPERLRTAIIKGNLPITKRLLSKFPELLLNIDPNNQGWCNLHYASFHGKYLVCFHLVSLMNKLHSSSGANGISKIDLLTFDNLTVLHMPLMNHHSQTLHFLLQEFSSDFWINFRGGPKLRTPLHFCCMYRFADGLKLLLEYGADWKVQDSNGDSCLHLCFAYGDLSCLRELIKFVASSRLKQSLSSPDDSESSPTKTIASGKIGEAPSASDKSATELKSIALEEIKTFEEMINVKGWKAVDYAASFELGAKYSVLREKWIDQAVNEEIVLRDPSTWDLSSSMYVFDRMNGLSRKGSVHSSASSSLANDGSTYLSHSSSAGGETGILLNPINPVHPMTPANESQASFDTTEKEKNGRQHSRSLPNSSVPDLHSPIEVAQEKRARANTVLPFNQGHSLSALRTPSLTQGTMVAPLTPNQNDVSMAAPSLKSITISPSYRIHKARQADEASEAVSGGISARAASRKSSMSDSGTSSPLVTTFKAAKGGVPASARPTATASMPMQNLRRWSVSSSQKPVDVTAHSSMARSAADAAVRSRGSSFKSSPGLSPQKSKSHSLKRNISTPSVFNSPLSTMDSLSSLSRKHSRQRSATESVKRPPFQLSRMADGHSSQESISPVVVSPGGVAPDGPASHAQTYRSPPTRVLVRENKGDESTLISRNLSSISFTRVRDEAGE